MKTLLLTSFTAVAVLTLSACTTVEEPAPSVTTTTVTEESTVVHPAVSPATTETRTIRSY